MNSSKKKTIKNNQQKIARLIDNIEGKLRKPIEAKVQEVNELKALVATITDEHRNQLTKRTNSLRVQHQQELEQKNQEINRLKKSIANIQRDSLKIEDKHKKQIEIKTREINQLKALVATITDEHQNQLTKRTNSLRVQHQQELEQKNQEINYLKKSIANIQRDSIKIAKGIANDSSKENLPISSKHNSLLINSPRNKLPDQYLTLEKYLINREWQNADRETANIIFEITNQNNSHLTVSDYQSIPLKDLVIIDCLWIYHSQSRFGISFQYEAYLRIACGQTLKTEKWREIGNLLGWRKNSEWVLNSNQLINSLDAIKGQLPFLIYWQGVWLGGFMDGQQERFLTLMARFSDALK